MLQKTRKGGEPAAHKATVVKTKAKPQAPDIRAALAAAESTLQKTAKTRRKQSSGCGCGW